MLEEATGRLLRGEDLAAEEAGAAAAAMLSGATGTDENAGFLSALARKGETADELGGMLDAMRAASVPAELPGAIDMCGTGGDGMRTFNVSTAASFVVAAAGGRVAKHGNRSSSGAFGSADMFERLGCDLGQDPAGSARSLDEHGICFLYAPRYHPGMARVAEARRMLGTRTAFNLLGPMCNPARVTGQLVGTSSAGHLRAVPAVLHERGVGRVMAVRAEDGMDELSTSSRNRVAEISGGRVQVTSVGAEEVGLHASEPSEIRVSTADEAFAAFVGAVRGTARRAVVETCALNAAAGLVVAGICDDLGSAVPAAAEAIASGAAAGLLERLARAEGDPASLEAVK